MKNLKIALTIILVLTFSFSTLAQDKAQNKKAKEQNKENKGKGGKPEDKGKPTDQNEKSEDQDKKEKGKPEDQGGKPDDKGKSRQDDKEKSDKGNDQKDKEDKEDKEFKGQGNAYGRNKGGLSGREFGQLRSQEARAKVKKDLEDSDLELAEQERQIGSTKSKIEEAIEKLKKEQEAKKSPDKNLEEKRSYYESVKEKILKKEIELKSERTNIKEALNKLEKEEQEQEN